jgi:putative RecB family exonuclease
MATTQKRPTPRNLFSFSRLKTLHQCPFRYRLRYLKGMKESFRSIETFLGTCVHEVLEHLYAARRQSADPSMDEALEAFDAQWRERWPENIAIVRVDEAPDTYFTLGRDLVARFHAGVFTRDRSDTIALEQRYSVKLSDVVTFTGIADRVGRTAQGRLFVVDYKTSKSAGTDAEFSEGLQALVYAACALRETDDEGALAGYHYLRLDDTRWYEVSRERGETLLRRIHELADQALATTEFPAKPGPLCSWCGFNHICTFADVPPHLEGGLRVAREQHEL